MQKEVHSGVCLIIKTRPNIERESRTYISCSRICRGSTHSKWDWAGQGSSWSLELVQSVKKASKLDVSVLRWVYALQGSCALEVRGRGGQKQ